MSEKLDRHEIMWAEMKPDCYGGDSCDQLIPRWAGFAEGDMDSDVSTDDFVLDPKLFPPGTKISITVPLCPMCHQVPELCQHDEFCNFDWLDWTYGQYC